MLKTEIFHLFICVQDSVLEDALGVTPLDIVNMLYGATIACIKANAVTTYSSHCCSVKQTLLFPYEKQLHTSVT